MVWSYVWEIVRMSEIEDADKIFRILAYIERNAALDTVSILLDLVSEAKKKGLTLEDFELVLSDLYTSLEADKQVALMYDPIFSYARSIIERAERIKRTGENQAESVNEANA